MSESEKEEIDKSMPKEHSAERDHNDNKKPPYPRQQNQKRPYNKNPKVNKHQMISELIRTRNARRTGEDST